MRPIHASYLLKLNVIGASVVDESEVEDVEEDVDPESEDDVEDEEAEVEGTADGACPWARQKRIAKERATERISIASGRAWDGEAIAKKSTAIATAAERNQ